MICDTTFLIDLIRSVPAAVRKAEELVDKKASLSVTAVTVFEIQRGLHRRSAVQKETLNRVLDGFDVLALDRASATRAAQIDENLQENGLEIEAEDCMIAGIALDHGESILTRNVKHFSRIPGLHVESY